MSDFSSWECGCWSRLLRCWDTSTRWCRWHGRSRPAATTSFGRSPPAVPGARFAAAAREVAPLWRSRGLDPRPYGGSYDTLYLDSSPPILQAQPADHVARRQLMRPHRDDGEFDESSALPFPEEPASS